MAWHLLWDILMTVALTMVVISVSAFVILVLYIAYQHNRFSHIPGPPRKDFLTGHVRLIMAAINRGSTLSDYLVDQMELYGTVFSLFMFYKPVVVCLEPSFVKKLLYSTTHMKTPAEVQYFWRVFGKRFLHHGLVTECDVPQHLKRRALFEPTFHTKYLKTLMSIFNEGVSKMIERLTLKADGKTEVFMLDELNKMTLDAIAKTAFGLDLLHDRGFSRAISMSLTGVEICFYKPWIQWSPLPAHRRFRQDVRECIQLLRETGRKCVQDRIDAKKRGDQIPQDILTYILHQSDDLQADVDFNMENMLDEFCTFFIAGQETTATLMSFMLVELGHHPEIMHRLKTESNAVLGDKEYVEYEDLGKLEYMMLVIKETLRIWPPVIGTPRQLASEETVLGFKIPAGTALWLNTYAMGRNQQYFKDPLVFDPDRHLKSKHDRHYFTHFPFSMGVRSCIGQQFALLESRLVMSRLLQTFDFQLVPGQERDDVIQEIIIKPKGRCRQYITLSH